jgi:hypothetical protein
MVPAMHRPALRRLTVTVLASVLAACGGVSVSLPEDIGAGFDLEATLDDLRNCDALSDTFVAVVREAAEDLDALAESTGGRVPAAELAERVDALSGTAYWEVARRMGCNAVAQRVDTLDRLRELSPDSEAGDDLVTEVIRQLEAQQPD